jgi:hypothetical protein
MKRFFCYVALVATFMTWGGCVTTADAQINLGSLLNGVLKDKTEGAVSDTTKNKVVSAGEGLGNLLGTLLGLSEKVSPDSITGTWNYTGVDCVFESENLLMKAGGEVAAAKVENTVDGMLSKVGIKPGSCSYTFNSDGTYSAVLGGRTLKGNYTLDAENQKITMHYLAGMAQSTVHIVLRNNTLSLLYESDKLLKMLTVVSALSNAAALKAVNQLLSSYSGMMVGMQFTR